MIRSVADLGQVTSSDVLTDGRVAVYIETMRLMSRYLDSIKGAYITGPFTLAGLLLGASEAAMATVTDPELMTAVLRFASGVIARYARALERAGADLICILEPTASFLSPKLFRQFALPYNREIIETLRAVPILHICGNTTHLLDGMVETGAHGLSLGPLVDFPAAAQRVPEDVVLIGNLDPVSVLRDMTPNGVYRTTVDLVDSMAAHPNFIVASGCDLPMDTPLENIHAMVDAVRGQEPAYDETWLQEAEWLPEMKPRD